MDYKEHANWKGKEKVLLPLGSGSRIPGMIPLKGTKHFYADKFLVLNENKPYKLNIPHHLTGVVIKNAFLNHLNVNMQPYKITSDSPQGLYLKIAFNARKVTKLKRC